MTLKQYTIESMSYLTTGILDSGEEDASVEAAMCKVSYVGSLISFWGNCPPTPPLSQRFAFSEK